MYATVVSYFSTVYGVFYNRSAFCGHHMFDTPVNAGGLVTGSNLGGLLVRSIQNGQENRKDDERKIDRLKKSSSEFQGEYRRGKGY